MVFKHSARTLTQHEKCAEMHANSRHAIAKACVTRTHHLPTSAGWDPIKIKINHKLKSPSFYWVLKCRIRTLAFTPITRM